MHLSVFLFFILESSIHPISVRADSVLFRNEFCTSAGGGPGQQRDSGDRISTFETVLVAVIAEQIRDSGGGDNRRHRRR